MRRLHAEDASHSGAWIVYLLQCADGSLYTGITIDLARRLQQHAEGKGAKYTRGRAPYTVIFVETHPTKGAALRREAEIKKLKRSAKLRLKNTD